MTHECVRKNKRRCVGCITLALLYCALLTPGLLTQDTQLYRDKGLHSVLLLVQGLGDMTERRQMLAGNILSIKRELNELHVDLRCIINFYGSIPPVLSDFEPCSFQQNGLGVEEFQRDTPAYTGELVFVLFDDVTLPHMIVHSLLKNMAVYSLTIATPACLGSGWRVMQPGHAGIYSKFYEPFFTLYSNRAWNCRRKLLRHVLSFATHTSPIFAMEWDKYEHGFCNSTIGILKDIVVEHTQIGGKDEKFVSSGPALKWSDLYQYMQLEFGILPLNHEEWEEVSHKSASFLDIANGNGYGCFNVLN